MFHSSYTTIHLSTTGRFHPGIWLAAAASGSFIFILLHIYFLYAAVSISHRLELAGRNYSDQEYAYQETAGEYKDLLKNLSAEYAFSGIFMQINDPEFLSHSSSLVLR